MIRRSASTSDRSGGPAPRVGRKAKVRLSPDILRSVATLLLPAWMVGQFVGGGSPGVR
jgi:hypothetical protein